MSTIRSAVESDFWPLVGLGKRFMEESHQNVLTWDDQVAWEFMWRVLRSDDMAILVNDKAVNDHAVLDAFAIIQVRRDYTVEPVCYIHTFYVAPESRKGRTAVVLLQEVLEYAKERNAAVIYAATTAELDTTGANNRAMRRLYERMGMRVFGEFFLGDLRHG